MISDDPVIFIQMTTLSFKISNSSTTDIQQNIVSQVLKKQNTAKMNKTCRSVTVFIQNNKLGYGG